MVSTLWGEFVNGIVMRSLVSDFRDTFRSPLLLIVWLFLTAIVSYSGPFGTYMALELPTRATYWGCVVALSIVTGCAIRLIVEHFMSEAHRLVKSLVHAVIMSTILAPLFYHGSVALMPGFKDQIPHLKALAVTIFFVAIAVTTTRNLWISAHTPMAHQNEVRLLARLEPEMRGRILRLCAGDHCVEVYTEHGTSTLRMRFSDALGELTGTPGMQVHRSHWVARDAIVGHMVDKGRLFLKLEDGAMVPVSRNYRAHVEESGLLVA